MTESCYKQCQGEPRRPVMHYTALGIPFASQCFCWPLTIVTWPLRAAYLFDWQTTSSADPALCSWTTMLNVPCSLCLLFAVPTTTGKKLYFESREI